MSQAKHVVELRYLWLVDVTGGLKKMEGNMTANEYIKVRFGRHMDQCTNEEIYIGLLEYKGQS